MSENGFAPWKIIEKWNDEIIGSCGFGKFFKTEEVEFGYLLAKKHLGKGYATEIAGAALAFGFDKLNFREIIALTNLENVGSQKV